MKGGSSSMGILRQAMRNEDNIVIDIEPGARRSPVFCSVHIGCRVTVMGKIVTIRTRTGREERFVVEGSFKPCKGILVAFNVHMASIEDASSESVYVHHVYGTRNDAEQFGGLVPLCRQHVPRIEMTLKAVTTNYFEPIVVHISYQVSG